MENNAEMKKLPFVAAKIDRLMDNDNSLKAFATVTIANSFMAHGLKVMEGSKGLFVAMPSRSFTTGQGETKYSDVCHAINAEMKQRIDAVVLRAYQLAIGQNQGATSDDLVNAPEAEEPTDAPVNEPVNEPVDAPVEDSTEDESFGFDFVPSM